MKPIFRFFSAMLLLTGLMGSACVRKSDVVRVALFTSDPIIINILNGVIQDIEKSHPGLHVRIENIPYGSFQDKITTEIVAGQPPDIISVEVNNFVDLYLRNAFEDLTPYIQKDNLDLNVYYESIMKHYSPGGHPYALPTDIAPVGLVYYNKKVFREAGVPYPTKDWKWPEPFLTICKKLLKRDANGKTVRWAFGDPYGIEANAFMLSNGGYYMDSETDPTRLTLDTPQVLEAFQFRWDLIHTWHVSPTQSEIQSFNFGKGTETMFVNGQIAMMDSGIWHSPTFLQHKDLDFDVVEFPHGPRGTTGWACGGSGYAIAKASKKKELAWLIVKELAGRRAEELTVSTGLIQPAMVSVAHSDAFLKSAGPEHKGILLDMPKNAHFGPFVKNWNEIWQGQVGPALDRTWLGQEKPEPALREITKQVNKKYFGIE